MKRYKIKTRWANNPCAMRHFFFAVDGDIVELGETWTSAGERESSLLPAGRYQLEWMHNHRTMQTTGRLVADDTARDTSYVGSNVQSGLSGDLVYRDGKPCEFVIDA